MSESQQQWSIVGDPRLGPVGRTLRTFSLDELKYDGWIGCEYRPAGTTAEGLAWLYRLIDRRPA